MGGNVVLRPRGVHGRGVSVTTHQEVNGTVQVKHKVNCVDRGYVIDVDAPHRCSSLAEAVQYFVESTKGSLQLLHRQYSPRLEFVQRDAENREDTRRGGERDPQSSAPHPAPHQALQLPHNHGMAEELAKKLQLRRALTGD